MSWRAGADILFLVLLQLACSLLFVLYSCYERLSIAPCLWKILNNRALSDFLMCLGLIFDQLTTAFPYCHNSVPCSNKFEVQFLTLKPNVLFFFFSKENEKTTQSRRDLNSLSAYCESVRCSCVRCVLNASPAFTSRLIKDVSSPGLMQ